MTNDQIQLGRERRMTITVNETYSYRSGKIDCGSIIKDYRDNHHIEAFMQNIETREPIIAELWACLINLKRSGRLIFNTLVWNLETNIFVKRSLEMSVEFHLVSLEIIFVCLFLIM